MAMIRAAGMLEAGRVAYVAAGKLTAAWATASEILIAPRNPAPKIFSKQPQAVIGRAAFAYGDVVESVAGRIIPT